LIRLGYLSADATGYYGNATEEAVKKLQKEYGYEADGIAGNTTLSLVDRLLGRGKTTAVSSSVNSKLLKEGDENTNVAEMQKKLIKLGYLNAKATGFFGPATTAAVKKLQKKYDYENDGIAGASTLALLSKLSNGSKVTATSKTPVKTVAVKTAVKAVSTGTEHTDEKDANQSKEVVETTSQTNFMPLWFGSVDKTFAIGDTANVYDIGTGLSFRVKRTYGHNHADCETISAKDTATMKKIFGGTWSWERRAVIVSVGGLKLAGSMSGMPHAGLDKYTANKTVSSRSGGFGRGTNLDAVKKNNMNGVFDIHFYKSKNHYNNKIDPKHQALVKAAAKWAEEHYKAK